MLPATLRLLNWVVKMYHCFSGVCAGQTGVRYVLLNGCVWGVGWGWLSVCVYRDLEEVCALCVVKEKGRDGVEEEEEEEGRVNMPQGTGDIHSAICAARWKSCPANYTSKAEAFCLSGSALMSWQKKAKGCHLKKKKKWRKWERWMSLVMECNPTPAFISFSPLHLKRGLPLSW